MTTFLHLLAQLPLTVLGPKCHTEVCRDVASSTVHWVNGSLRCCSGCTTRWRAIATALGMHPVVDPLPAWVLPDEDPTVQRFAAMELE